MFANIVPCQAISLVSENVLQHIPAIPSHEHTTFPNFSKNLLNEVNLVHLNKWLVQQRPGDTLECKYIHMGVTCVNSNLFIHAVFIYPKISIHVTNNSLNIETTFQVVLYIVRPHLSITSSTEKMNPALHMYLLTLL